MKRLVVVSNRVVNPECQAAGGLAVCILDGLRERGGIWFGWNGEIVADESGVGVACSRHDNVTIITMPLTERDYQEYYLGFCNAALWPVLHYRLDLARFTQESSEAYRRVNDRFAEKLAPLLTPGDLVWAHDYHLIPLAEGLRARGVRNRLGFFLHVPFPPPDVLFAMPEHEWIMNAFVQYDVLGFQTKLDQANFTRFACEHMGGEMVSDELLRIGENVVSVSTIPVGINVEFLRRGGETSRGRRAHTVAAPARRAAGEYHWGRPPGLHKRAAGQIPRIQALARTLSAKLQGGDLDADRPADARGGEGLCRHSA